jgi:hypothetical protein
VSAPRVCGGPLAAPLRRKARRADGGRDLLGFARPGDAAVDAGNHFAPFFGRKALADAVDDDAEAALERLPEFGPLRQGEGLRQENAAKRRDVLGLHLAADAARGDELDDQAALSGMEAGVHLIGASQSAPKVGTTAADCQVLARLNRTSCLVKCSSAAAWQV